MTQIIYDYITFNVIQFSVTWFTLKKDEFLYNWLSARYLTDYLPTKLVLSRVSPFSGMVFWQNWLSWFCSRLLMFMTIPHAFIFLFQSLNFYLLHYISSFLKWSRLPYSLLYGVSILMGLTNKTNNS